MLVNLSDSLLTHNRQRMEEYASADGYEFFPGQLEFYSRVSLHNSAQIAADTGTGKTLGAITLARLSGAERTLMIVPRAVIPQWKNEIKRFWKGIRVHVGSPKGLLQSTTNKGVFLTYPEAIFHGWPRLSDKVSHSFGCVVLDESHIYGNAGSQFTQGMLALRARHRYAFSATPLRNALPDLFPVLGWLSHEHWPEERTPAFDFEPDEVARFRGTLESGQLDGWIKEKVFVLDKEECGPDTVSATLNVQRVPLSRENASNYLTLFNGGFGFDQAGSRHSALRGFCARPETSPKNTAILSRVKSLVESGEQVVVVCSRTIQTDALHDSFLTAGIACSRIDGTVQASTHGDEAGRFKEGVSRVMLMGIKCAQSHSFECARHLVLGSMEYSFSSFWQALGRVWRVTSTRPVVIDCFVLAGTIEEKILEAVLAKQDLAKKTIGLKYKLTKNLTTWPSSVLT